MGGVRGERMLECARLMGPYLVEGSEAARDLLRQFGGARDLAPVEVFAGASLGRTPFVPGDR